jgi:hypothetical protein
MKWIGEKVDGDRYTAPNGEGRQNLEKDIKGLKEEFDKLTEEEYGPSKLETYQQFEKDEVLSLHYLSMHYYFSRTYSIHL